MVTRQPDVAETTLSLIAARLADADLGAAARDYLEKQRGVDREVIRQFKVGLYSSNAVKAGLEKAGFALLDAHGFAMVRPAFEDWLAFPWLDTRDRLHGFVFRALPEMAMRLDRLGRPVRYAFCGDRDSLPLYGLASAKTGDGDRLVVIESTIGLLLLRSHGFDECVAANSCQLRIWHTADLKRRGLREIVLCLDSDVPGRRGTMKSVEACIAVGLPVRVATLPEGAGDADTFVQRCGPDALRSVLSDTECGLTYAASQLLGSTQNAERSTRLQAAADLHTLRPPGNDCADLTARFWEPVAREIEATADEIRTAVQDAYRRRIDERARRGLPPFPIVE